MRDDATKLDGWGAQDTVLISRKPFTAADLDNVRRLAAASHMEVIYLPGEPVPPGTPSEPKPKPKPEPADPAPKPGSGAEQPRSGKKRKKKEKLEENTDDAEPEVEAPARKKRKRPRRTPLRNPDGSPTRSNPGFVDALPGPSFTTGENGGVSHISSGPAGTTSQ